MLSWTRAYPFVAQVSRAGCTLLLLPSAAHIWDTVSLGLFLTFYAVSAALSILVDRGFASAGYYILSLSGTVSRATVLAITRRRLHSAAAVLVVAAAAALLFPQYAEFFLGSAILATAGGISMSFQLNFERRGGLFVLSKLASPASLLVAPLYAWQSGSSAGVCFLLASVVALLWNSVVVFVAVRGASASAQSAPTSLEVAALNRARLILVARFLTYCYTFASVPIATALHGPASGAMVGLAERTNGLLALVVRPVGLSLAGESARLGHSGAATSLRRIRLACAGLVLVWLVYAAAIVFFYDSVADVIFGEANVVPSHYMLIFALAYLFSGINTFISAGYLSPLGKFESSLRAVGISAFTFLLIAVALQQAGAITVAIARLLAELVYLIYVIFQIRNHSGGD